jgi:hypothetical protein
MPMESQAKLEADIQLVQAETEKIRAEIAKMERESEVRKSKIGEFIIEGIKVFGALVLGAGGVIAAYSGYQLSEVKKERLELEATKAQERLTQTTLELDTVISNRKKAEKSLAAMTSQLAATRSELDMLSVKLSEAKDKLTPGPTSAALESAIKSARQLEVKVGAVGESAKDIQQAYKEKLYYVIAMTSAKRDDILTEVNRVRKNVGAAFDKEFPSIEIYAPEGGLYTLLISGKSLPYSQANQLKQRAIAAGFSKDTWLWQSSVDYFAY